MNAWITQDLKYNWHPYTQMKDCFYAPPILIERAKGIKLYDHKGNFYYDTISSWWCNVHGHNHPVIKKAIKKQLDRLEHVLFAGFTHKPAILLSEKVISLAPEGLTKVFYSDNGSTAVEIALKMSFQYWQNIGKKQKQRFVSLDYGYHGDTIGAMSVSGIDLFNEMFSPMFFPAFKVPSPYCYRCPMGKKNPDCRIECIEPLEKLLKDESENIAALILEPMVLAAGGMIVYPKEYLIRAGQLARRFNVHLILDEVATGFGRTGKMFACEYAKIKPDFMCLSKGLTGGYLPLAMTLTTDKIYNAFYADYEDKKTFYHGHTYTANPLSCSAALASLNVFERENTLERLKEITPLFHKRLEAFRKIPSVGDARYLGLIGGVELAPFDLKERVDLRIYKKALRNNLILRPLGNILYFFLPLCIKRYELEEIMDRAYSVLKEE